MVNLIIRIVHSARYFPSPLIPSFREVRVLAPGLVRFPREKVEDGYGDPRSFSEIEKAPLQVQGLISTCDASDMEALGSAAMSPEEEAFFP